MELKLTKFSIKGFLRKNIFRKDLSFAELIKYQRLLWKGFDVDSIRLYGLTLDKSSRFLPDKVRPQISLKTNVDYWPVLHDKLFFHLFFRKTFRVPKLFGFVKSGYYSIIDLNKDSEFGLSGLLKSNDLVLKPLQGGKGKGIIFCRYNIEQKSVCWGEDTISVIEFERRVLQLDNYGIFQYIPQHPVLDDIFRDSINTIRLVSLLFANELRLVGVLRIGNSKSTPFDNFSQGGMVALIDLETGVLSSAVMRNVRGESEFVDYHPDTGSVIKGVKVPYWKDIVTEFRGWLDSNAIFDYVGWDILVGQDGYYLIEGNHNPDIDLIQVHFPYLDDPIISSFFKDRLSF